jgi:hypothetical protein
MNASIFSLRRAILFIAVFAVTFSAISVTPDAAHARETEVPINVGFGPALLFFGNPSIEDPAFSGPITEDQPFHYALRLRLAARIDHDWVKENPRAVPKEYRSRFTEDTVVYIRPAAMILIPRDIIVSPPVHGSTQIYGGTWEPVGVGIPMVADNIRLSLGASLVFTYAYINSDAFASPTHFLRPGAALGAELRVNFTDNFAMSLGWDSNMYLPQKVGGGVFSGPDDAYSLWHIGEAFLQFHVIFPYMTEL